MAEGGIIPITKRCSRCQRVLPASEFGRHKATPTGLRAYCKACHSLTERARRDVHADALREADRCRRAANLEARLEQERRAHSRRRARPDYLAEVRLRETARLMAEHQVKPPAECRVCGNIFKAPFGRQSGIRTCSDECRRALRRSRVAKKHSKRRAQKKGAPAGGVDPYLVFERDGWRYHMCRKITSKKKRGSTHPMAPELDHILPLSKGGAHAYDNVACACRACNMRKGTKPLGQMLMFADVVAA